MIHPKSDKPLRPDLQQVREARAAILDDARPKAVAQPRQRGRWTGRAGIAPTVAPARPVVLRLHRLCGTQSAINHMKTTRMFEHAERHRLPVVCWLDGGGARPHDMKVEGRGAPPPFVGL